MSHFVGYGYAALCTGALRLRYDIPQSVFCEKKTAASKSARQLALSRRRSLLYAETDNALDASNDDDDDELTTEAQ